MSLDVTLSIRIKYDHHVPLAKQAAGSHCGVQGKCSKGLHDVYSEYGFCGGCHPERA